MQEREMCQITFIRGSDTLAGTSQNITINPLHPHHKWNFHHVFSTHHVAAPPLLLG